MANTANSAISTNLNVTPYYDDFDENKNYHRILYKPGYAVQARELTQMQSILQNQIDRFGKHIFTEGSIVIPGAFDLYTANSTYSSGPVQYVKVKDIDDANVSVTISNFSDVEVVGQTSNVKAFISIVLDGSESTSNNKTIYVDYLNVANSNSDIKTFTAGEILTSNIGNLVVVDTNPIGTASAFRISEGVVFSKGHFVKFATQEVVLDRYNDTPTCKVGFKIFESIVTAATDSSLLDPALEASNYSAPGADRFKLEAELQVRSYEDDEDLPDFVTLFTIKDGVIQTMIDRTQYSIIKDELAKRTFDESGDYYVKGLGVDLREHLDTGTNGGRYSAAQGGNNSLLSVRVDPGVGYVKGYEIGIIVPNYLTTEKSTAYDNVNSQIVSAFMGSFVTVDEVVGSLALNKGTTIDLYDTFENRISTNRYTTAPTGNLIGTAVVASLEYNSGTLGLDSGRADLYITDIKMLGTNAFSKVKSVYLNNASSADFGADVVPNAISSTTVLNEPFNAPLLYYTGSEHTRKIRGTSGSSDTTYYYATSSSVTIANGGTFTVSAPGSDSLPYTGTLSTTDKREIFLTVDSAVNVALTGTASNTGNTITISSPSFAPLIAGDKIEFSGQSNTYTILTKISSTQVVLAESELFSSLSSSSVYKAYKAGSFIDLTTLGATTGTVRSVTASGGTLSFNLNETLPSSVAATVTFRAARTSAREAAKVLRPSRYVQINCAASGTTGPYNLGFSDVYRIRQIRKHSALFTSNTEGSNVTSSFTFDNGQRDSIYDLASITPKSTLSSSDKLLVELDYFIPDYSQGKGYFSVDSYPIDDANATSTTITTAEIPIYKSPSSGATYNLRNHIDFRLVKTNTANDSTTVAGASISPALSSTFNYTGTGISLIAPSTEIDFDYSFYLGRKDVVHVNKDKVFSITKGKSSSYPITPQISDNDMALAILTIAPYPSISNYYAKIINRQDIASSVRRVAPVRHTMRDIGVMKDRIQNLEYYASLSLLEKSAADMMILDETGLDRFKNGIFVDTFSNHGLGATYNPDYRIVVDKDEKTIRPLYSMNSLNYDYLTGSGIRKTGDLITLDYTEVEYANVFSATSTLNTEKSTYKFLGDLTLVPENDVWVDTKFLPPNMVNLVGASLDGTQDATQQGGITTEWNAWQSRITGYRVYRGTGSNRVLAGTYSDRAQAFAAAEAIRAADTTTTSFLIFRTTTTGSATVETLFENTRTGTEYFKLYDSDQTSLGIRVVDTEIIPFIRPQVLIGTVVGVKPFAKYAVFFDGIDMTDYVRPITASEYSNPASVQTWTNAEGTALYADANGEMLFRLRLPNSDNLRFTVGQKQVRVTDSLTNSEEATSFAEEYFLAQGILQTKQETILSTQQVIDKQRSVRQLTNTSTFTELPSITTAVFLGSCLAYVLPIKAPDGEEGIFLTSVEVFCEQKHPTLGVWFEVRELDAGGGITLNTVPFSKKWYKNSEVPISTDGRTNGLKVTFDSPIFLYSDKSYAFVIHPEAANPNYYFWISKIGENDVNTGRQVTSRAYLGATYTTNNNTLWNMKDQIDLTCRWNRASFISAGQFEIGNKPKDKLYFSDKVGSIEGFGEPISSGDKITLSGYSGGTIVANDMIIGANSAVNSKVINVASGRYNMSNIRYTVGESVTVRNGSNGDIRGTATIATILLGNGFLEDITESANSSYVVLNGSNGVFSVGDSIFDVSDEGSAKITSISNMRYSLIDFEPVVLTFSKTNQTFEMQTYSNTSSLMPYVSIEAGENYEFIQEMSVFSRANEIASLGGARSNRVLVNMSTTSTYLSPVFDIGKTQSIIVDNLINNDATDENLSSGGALFNKYISKIVTLADGQDAEDIKVFLTAYRPPNTDVRVWLKILNGEDSDTMAQRPWIELEKTFGGDITYSSLATSVDFREYTYNIPDSYKTGSQDQVQYTSSQGIVFTGYKSFQIKIGLLGTNSAIVPRVADLRTIALQI